MKKEEITMFAFLTFFAGFFICLAISLNTTTPNSLCITNETLINQTEASFIYGMNYALMKITNESIQCNQIPMNYSGYEYTLYPLECLELNSMEEK